MFNLLRLLNLCNLNGLKIKKDHFNEFCGAVSLYFLSSSHLSAVSCVTHCWLCILISHHHRLFILLSLTFNKPNLWSPHGKFVPHSVSLNNTSTDITGVIDDNLFKQDFETDSLTLGSVARVIFLFLYFVSQRSVFSSVWDVVSVQEADCLFGHHVETASVWTQRQTQLILLLFLSCLHVEVSQV